MPGVGIPISPTDDVAIGNAAALSGLLAPSAPSIALASTFTIGATITITPGAGGGPPVSFAEYADGVATGRTVAATGGAVSYTIVAGDIGPAVTFKAVNAAGTSAASNSLAYSYASVTAVVDVFEINTLTPGLIATLTGAKAGISLTAAGAARPTASATSFNSHPGLAFDGVANILAGTANLSAYSSLRLVLGMLDATTALSVCMELTSNVTAQNGAFNINVNATAGCVGGNARGTTNFGGCDTPETLAAACAMSVCVDTSITKGCQFIRKNGAALTLTTRTNTCGAGNFANSTLNLGARSGALFPWAGTVGGALFIMSGAAQDGDLSDAEAYVAWRAGL